MVPSRPKITVLMPVFNGGGFLRQAVESILGQTFADFEFLVIDDGSTDRSAEVVASFGDPRIRLVENGINLGLVKSLNRGVGLARGEYVARMDCDDVSLPDRLERQARHLDANPSCAAVAVMVRMIDERGRECGDWPDDRKTRSHGEIVRFLPRANCIAHPGVMIRRSVLSAYVYHDAQIASEDYDLWLRMCADGLVIDKIGEPLLLYRINPLSVTSLSRGRGSDFKNLRTKAVFLRERLAARRLNPFVVRVFLYMLRDLGYCAVKKTLGVMRRLISLVS